LRKLKVQLPSESFTPFFVLLSLEKEINNNKKKNKNKNKTTTTTTTKKTTKTNYVCRKSFLSPN